MVWGWIAAPDFPLSDLIEGRNGQDVQVTRLGHRPPIVTTGTTTTMKKNIMLKRIRILTVFCVLIPAAPAMAQTCVTPKDLDRSGVILEMQSGVAFVYRRDGNILRNAIHENGLEAAASELGLAHHGILAKGWDRTDIGEGLIDHVYDPKPETLPEPASGVVIRVTRTNLRASPNGTADDEPITTEQVEFRFGEADVFEVGACTYPGLRLETKTMTSGRSEPIQLSGIWLSDFEIFIIERVWLNGSFDTLRIITGFRPSDRKENR